MNRVIGERNLNYLPVKGNSLNVFCPKLFALRIFDGSFALPQKNFAPQSFLCKVFALQHKAFNHSISLY